MIETEIFYTAAPIIEVMEKSHTGSKSHWIIFQRNYKGTKKAGWGELGYYMEKDFNKKRVPPAHKGGPGNH